MSGVRVVVQEVVESVSACVEEGMWGSLGVGEAEEVVGGSACLVRGGRSMVAR